MPRIFKQLGQGYGESPVSIVAKIDGNTVFSGTVPTINSAVPGEMLSTALGVDCFSWTDPVADFQGTRNLSIAVSGGFFQTGETMAQISTDDPEHYGWVYTSNIGDVIFSDPLTEVSIDGSVKTRPEDTDLPGQWGWTIPSGSTLTATLNINKVMSTYIPGNTPGSTVDNPS